MEKANDSVVLALWFSPIHQISAQAYESEVVNRAKGDTDRFMSIYNSYKVDPDVTRSRMYLETMEKVLANVNKIIMDKSSSSSGIVPYLPIDKLQGKGVK